MKVDQAKLSRLALEGCDVPALEARQLVVTGDLSLARSRVRWVGLLGSHIGGRLVLTDARLSNTGGETLNADGADIGQDVLCRRLRASGEITLVGANIGGSLDVAGASIYPLGMLATKASIGADFKCDKRTRVRGTVRLGSTRISGLLDLGDAVLRGSGGTAVDLEGAKVGKLVLPSKRVPRGMIDLTRTRAGHLDDDWESVPYQARINGLVYDTLSKRGGSL